MARLTHASWSGLAARRDEDRGAPVVATGLAPAARELGRSRRARAGGWMALLFTTFIAVVWLNQGTSLRAWSEARSRPHGVLSAVRAPFDFLYRRALDEEMYFATASAVFGRPYDEAVLGIRGDTPLPRVSVPADGRLHAPYGEVPFEYPPPNVPFVLAPRLFGDTFEIYARLFGALMGAALVASAALAARLGSSGDRAEWARRMIAFGLLLLAHGGLAIQRLDAIVAVVLVLVVRSAARGDDRSLGFWSGIAAATKIVPVFVALAVVVAGRWRIERPKPLALGGALGLAVGLGPMLLLAPRSALLMLRYHGDRGLHVESSLGVLYGAARALSGAPAATTLDYGSFNFHGAVADGLAKASPIVLLALVGAVLWACHRPATASAAVPSPAPASSSATALTQRIVLAALGATIAVWLGGKVFSPQYLTWSLPLAIALPGRSWRRVALALGVVLVLSQLYYRGYYDHVYRQLPLGLATLAARLALLGALFALVVRRLRRIPPGAAPPSEPAGAQPW